MRTLTRTLLLGAAAASLLAAPAANAGTNCVGPSSLYFCLYSPNASVGERTECVYLGGSTCRNVTVPTVETSGELGWYCGGMWRCVSPALDQ
ncbi:MAG TPA: hypothetical protein VGX28_03690 [Frankiaceae bacterium]|jgi:hypothetical protein|nr:hypothetical protein [Frankiaceae bacterium]